MYANDSRNLLVFICSAFKKKVTLDLKVFKVHCQNDTAQCWSYHGEKCKLKILSKHYHFHFLIAIIYLQVLVAVDIT